MLQAAVINKMAVQIVELKRSEAVMLQKNSASEQASSTGRRSTRRRGRRLQRIKAFNALEQCHHNSTIHDDLKLLNALRLDGKVLVVDMGTSCASSSEGDLADSDQQGSARACCRLRSSTRLEAGEEEQYRK